VIRALPRIGHQVRLDHGAGEAADEEAPAGMRARRDNRDGLDPSSTWRSIERVNQADLGPGDVVRFEAGARFAGTLFPDAKDDGTAASPGSAG
jgi:hypothetical protein